MPGHRTRSKVVAARRLEGLDNSFCFAVKRRLRRFGGEGATSKQASQRSCLAGWLTELGSASRVPEMGIAEWVSLYEVSTVSYMCIMYQVSCVMRREISEERGGIEPWE